MNLWETRAISVDSQPILIVSVGRVLNMNRQGTHALSVGSLRPCIVSESVNVLNMNT